MLLFRRPTLVWVNRDDVDVGLNLKVRLYFLLANQMDQVSDTATPFRLFVAGQWPDGVTGAFFVAGHKVSLNYQGGHGQRNTILVLQNLVTDTEYAPLFEASVKRCDKFLVGYCCTPKRAGVPACRRAGCAGISM